MNRAATFIIVAAIAAVLPSATFAQSSYGWTDGAGAPPAGTRRSAGASRGRYCQQLCVADTSPCDPPEFKVADGRCQDLWRF